MAVDTAPLGCISRFGSCWRGSRVASFGEAGYRGNRRMIAQVTQLIGLPDAPDQATEEQAIKQILATDGCEGFLSLRDGHDGININFWRERGAYDGYTALRDKLTAEARKVAPDTKIEQRVYQMYYGG